MSLPKRIIPIPNPDKKFHEKWTKKRDMLNFPAPSRILLFGRPNVGKTTIIKNIILRAKPAFEEVVVIHPDAEYTQEYDDLEGVVMLDEIPQPKEWEGEVKTLCIIDDMEFKTMASSQKYALDRLFGYVSTHKNVSVCLSAQDGFNVPPIVRRTANVFILWDSPDLDAVSKIARKTGLTPDKLRALFKIVGKGKNSLWIDMTDNTPYPLRRNGYEKIVDNTKH